MKYSFCLTHIPQEGTLATERKKRNYNRKQFHRNFSQAVTHVPLSRVCHYTEGSLAERSLLSRFLNSFPRATNSQKKKTHTHADRQRKKEYDSTTFPQKTVTRKKKGGLGKKRRRNSHSAPLQYHRRTRCVRSIEDVQVSFPRATKTLKPPKRKATTA